MTRCNKEINGENGGIKFVIVRTEQKERYKVGRKDRKRERTNFVNLKNVV
jgi:hypothetical protein